MDVIRTAGRREFPEVSARLSSRIGSTALERSAILLLFAVLGACGPTDRLQSTADRVKIVEVRQKQDPNFYLPRGKQAAPDPETLASSSLDVVDKPAKTSVAVTDSVKLR